MLRKHFFLAIFLTALLTQSCHDSVNLPEVKGPPLGVKSENRAKDPELKVLFVSPQGKADQTHLQIVATFNKAMIPLSQVEKKSELQLIEVDPPLKGKQWWMSSRTLSFIPEKPLLGSNQYRFAIKKGVKALDGTELKNDKNWSVETPRLKLMRHRSPSYSLSHFPPQGSIKVLFNQPIDSNAVSGKIYFNVLNSKTKKRIAANVFPTQWYRYRKNRQNDRRALSIKPRTPLPLNSKIALVFEKGLKSLEGPLVSNKKRQVQFRTYGPLVLEKLPCTKNCSPNRSIALSFNNTLIKGQTPSIWLNGKRVPFKALKYPTYSLYLGTKLLPRTSYTIEIRGSLRDKFGQNLQGNRRLSFTTGDYRPYANLSIPSGILEQSSPKKVRINLRNIEYAAVSSQKLSKAELSHLLNISTSKWSIASAKNTQFKALQTKADNSLITRYLDLSHYGLGSIVATSLNAKANTKKHKDRQANRIIRITDLGITAKYSPYNTLLWVTKLSTGKAIANASVEIWRAGEKKALWRGKTDKYGLALGPGTNTLGNDKKRNFIYFAQTKKDMSYTLSNTQWGLRAWDYGINESWNDGNNSLDGLVFSDRGIYRPGETVHLKTILRYIAHPQLVTPKGKIKIAIYSSTEGDAKAYRKELLLNEFGSASLDYSIPTHAPLGYYTVSVTHQKNTVTGSFRVEEYRPAEFALKLSSDKPSYIRGETSKWKLSANYLFGAPMQGADYRGSLSWRTNHAFQIPGYTDFSITDFEAEMNSNSTYSRGNHIYRYFSLKQNKLDARGETTIKKALKPKKMYSALNVSLENTVYDISRQSIATRKSVILHPGHFYIAAKADNRFIKVEEEFKASVFALSPKGKRFSNKSIKGQFYRRVWYTVRQKGMNGSTHYLNKVKHVPAGSCALISANKAKTCSFKPKESGYYFLRLSSQDKVGNSIRTSIGFYVAGKDYVPWRRDNSPRIEIMKDKKEYRVGDTARLMIKSPFKHADAILTVERNGIISKKPLRIRANAQLIKIPITEKAIPNIFVSLSLIQGRRKSAPKQEGISDPGKPLFLMGYTTLNITPKAKALAIKIKTNKKSYQPGEEVKVDLRSFDHLKKGKKAEITLMVADEGVLSLIGHKTPNPMATFYRERGLSVRTADNRLVIIDRNLVGDKGRNPGGGGGGGYGSSSRGVRSKFVSSPYFNPSIVTDSSGKAQVSFKLPDNLTTFRIMAVATTDKDQFGHGQTTFKVNKPLLLLPALPRFLRVNDEIEAGIVVHNPSGYKGRLTINTEAKGIQLIGKATQAITISDSRPREIRFRYKALAPGKAAFLFKAKLNDFEDKLKLRREIKLPLVKESVATSGSTERVVAEKVVPTEALRKDFGGLDLSLSSSALVGLQGSFDYLLNYRYECTEQLVSRLVPLALYAKLSTAFGFDNKEKRDKTIERLIHLVQKRQRWSGDFSYWTDFSGENDWLSAYATWGLYLTQKAGYAINKTTLKRATSYLKRKLNRKLKKDATIYQRVESVYITDVLAQMGEKMNSTIHRLYQARDELPAFSKSFLASAMAHSGFDKKARDKVLQEIINTVFQDDKYARVEKANDDFQLYFHSSNRATAILLSVLLKTNPNHPLIEKLVAQLNHVKKDGRWGNTQETLYALKAMHDYFQKKEDIEPDFEARVVLNQKTLFEQDFEGYALKVKQKHIPMKSLYNKAGILGFVKKGKGKLFYSASFSYARKELPKKPVDEGLLIERSYDIVNEDDAHSIDTLRGKKAKTPSTQDVKAGSLVRIKLKIVAPQHYRFVAISDPLPAGLEAINFNLMTSTQSNRRYQRSDRKSGNWWHSPFYHREIHDDRVELFADSLRPGIYYYTYLARATAIGDFVTPPSKVELMYQPHIFGRTAATLFKVKP